MFCSQCGAKISDNGKFCITCGAALPVGKYSEAGQAPLYWQTVSEPTGINASSPGSDGKKNNKSTVKAVIMLGIGMIWLIIFISTTIPRNVVDKQYSWGAGKELGITGTYTGRWKNGQPFESGTMTYSNGNVYEGEWAAGIPNGQGTIRYADGTIFRGEIYHGTLKQGTMKYTDGSTYIGEFLGSMPSGQGTMKYTYGSTYIGEFSGGMPSGQGTITYPDGSVYEGEFFDGCPIGHGTWIDTDGSKISGTWVNGEFVPELW